MNKNYFDLLFFENTKIKDVLSRFNSTVSITNGKGFGLIVNKNLKCLGTITDGDLRRGLSKFNINQKIKKIYNKKFLYVKENDSNNKILRLFENAIENKNKYLIFPVLNNKKKLVDIVNYDFFLNNFLISNKNPSVVKAKVPARISFSGGGTDFSVHINRYKTTILSSTIDKFINVAVKKRQDSKILIENHLFKKKYKFKLNNITKKKKDLVENIIFCLKPSFGFNMIIKSDIELGTGLGGSSALTMAIIACIKKLQNEIIKDPYDLINYAYNVERIVSKLKGGWQDYYSCFIGGFNWIEMDKNDNAVKPLKISRKTILELESNIMLFRFGKKRSSNNIQYKNEKYMNTKKNYLLKYYKNFKDNSLKMKKSLLLNSLDEFSSLLDKSWELKKKISPFSTNKKIEKIYRDLKKLGMKGGKILGAGNSGYLMLYANINDQMEIKKFLKEFGFKQSSFNFTSSGLSVWES